MAAWGIPAACEDEQLPSAPTSQQRVLADSVLHQAAGLLHCKHSIPLLGSN